MSFRSLPATGRTTLRLLALAALAAPFAAAPAPHASSVTYNILLSPTSGLYAGSGTLTLAAAPPSSGTVTYSVANQQLQDLAFSIDDQNFFLSGDTAATVQFTNGQLTAINFLQTVNGPPDRFTLELSNGFTLYGNGFGDALASGSFTATPQVTLPDPPPSNTPASPTPEPGSLLLLATALLLGGVFVLRRNRRAES